MPLPSMRLPTAVALGATLMAWRAYAIAPEYSVVTTELMLWTMLCPLVLGLGLFWELVRWYQRMGRHYSPEV